MVLGREEAPERGRGPQHVEEPFAENADGIGTASRAVAGNDLGERVRADP